jgi:hypothetical protein
MKPRVGSRQGVASLADLALSRYTVYCVQIAALDAGNLIPPTSTALASMSELSYQFQPVTGCFCCQPHASVQQLLARNGGLEYRASGSGGTCSEVNSQYEHDAIDAYFDHSEAMHC